jgi:UDP-N-acetyl-D-mannosaminuronate dehydrogenase
LAYKENTSSIKNANSIYLINKFKEVNFYGYDPIVKNIKMRNFHFIESRDLFLFSKIIIITNSSKDFLYLFIKNKEKINNKIIIDPYNILSSINLKKSNKIFSLGKLNEF